MPGWKLIDRQTRADGFAAMMLEGRRQTDLLSVSAAGFLHARADVVHAGSQFVLDRPGYGERHPLPVPVTTLISRPSRSRSAGCPGHAHAVTTVLQEAALHQELHPPQPLPVLHPASRGCAAERPHTLQPHVTVLEPAVTGEGAASWSLLVSALVRTQKLSFVYFY